MYGAPFGGLGRAIHRVEQAHLSGVLYAQA